METALEFQAPLWRRIAPLILGLIVSGGAILLWRGHHMHAGGAWLACGISVFYVQALKRFEAVRVELLMAATAASRAVGSPGTARVV